MGIQVISGMASGIDAAAQRGAVNKGGYSLAVLGCGVDICYPRSNIELYMQLQNAGGIMSEYTDNHIYSLIVQDNHSFQDM